ncbi:phosphohistidine phosphatase SixA [Thalassotalea piscium]|uniref:Phosphohistidine phosphatase n=1 Tax=Thalassotalea piscium TaxID=1230533 RepID=A0A7X0NE98_9GAMM|nr:phosphohistidine phosphatase SixA [Thalassotalea piscium]MBB6541855.1 phosphohistidine phosphatase [Thalassotalea piscium]
MQLFVMRHGQATPFSESDANRKLTKNGFDEVEKMASWLNSAHGDIERILVSPYVRAQQTAQQIIKHPKIFAKPITVDFITPEGNAKQVHDYIDGLLTSATIESILIVSHMPLVSYLLAELTLESNAPIFQTAAIAHIDYDVTLMKGRLVSLISPSDI